jgi:hypothetical protein
MPSPSPFYIRIPTVQSLQRQRRQVDRRRAGAARVLSDMQCGQSLHKHHTTQGPVFTLSGGKPVSVAVAAVVIADLRVVAVDDGLFRGTPQTWRWSEI